MGDKVRPIGLKPEPPRHPDTEAIADPAAHWKANGPVIRSQASPIGDTLEAIARVWKSATWTVTAPGPGGKPETKTVHAESQRAEYERLVGWAMHAPEVVTQTWMDELAASWRGQNDGGKR